MQQKLAQFSVSGNLSIESLTSRITLNTLNILPARIMWVTKKELQSDSDSEMQVKSHFIAIVRMSSLVSALCGKRSTHRTKRRQQKLTNSNIVSYIQSLQIVIRYIFTKFFGRKYGCCDLNVITVQFLILFTNESVYSKRLWAIRTKTYTAWSCS